MVIKVKYFGDDIKPLESIEKGDWIDMRAAETIKLKAGDFKLIPLGVAMELPTGYEGHIVPRSSTFKKWGLLQTNSCGIVDSSYCGPNDQWMMPVLATRDVTIEKHDRICQFRIMETQPKIEFEVSDLCGNSDRSGFGSTGSK